MVAFHAGNARAGERARRGGLVLLRPPVAAWHLQALARQGLISQNVNTLICNSKQ